MLMLMYFLMLTHSLMRVLISLLTQTLMAYHCSTLYLSVNLPWIQTCLHLLLLCCHSMLHCLMSSLLIQTRLLLCLLHHLLMLMPTLTHLLMYSLIRVLTSQLIQILMLYHYLTLYLSMNLLWIQTCLHLLSLCFR